MFRCTLLVLALAQFSFAQEWTRFRGPNGTGQSDALSVPTEWDDDDYNWVIDLPGIGHSCPVLWGDRIFIQSADPESGRQFVICINAKTGHQHWRRQFESSTYHVHLRNSFASSTPAVDQDRVYVTWATPEQIKLLALSHDGEMDWSREDLGPFASQHGYGTSPMVVDNKVILQNLQMPSDRGSETSSVSAYAKSDGATLWTTPRTSGKTSYSVPALRRRGKQLELILCSTTHGMFGLDLETGKETWSVTDAFKMRTVSSPVIAGDIVFGSTGSGRGGNYAVAIDMNRGEVIYSVKRSAPYVPCVVTHEHLAFLWSDKGVVSCIDIESGDSFWSERVGGNFSGSPVRVGSAVYCIAEDGTVVVLAASERYKLLGKMPLGQDSRSTPAVANGTMYLRTNSKLFSIGG